jgi:uncharacterized protein
MWLESGSPWSASPDVPALIEGGWKPFPFCEFIVKIHSRCDLSCDYCYMYEMADQSWKDQPRAMRTEIAQLTADRIAEHALAHGTGSIALILHGGEPLLAGRDLIRYLVTATREAAGPAVRVDARIQTNAVGLSEAYLDLFDELDIRIGVSLDGDALAHDRHRRFASGRGSYAAVAAALTRLREQRPHLFSGLLCTIDLRNDPIATYEALLAFDPPKIDFLLPHGTWARPPPARVPDPGQTPYGDWLATIFDRWYPHPPTGVRLFEQIMQLLLGKTVDSETVGLSPARMVVIETDGSVEQTDTLKAAYAGAAQTGLHLRSHSLDEALAQPAIVARQLGERALSAQCRACPLMRVCGGGLYTHRYREDNGFANPSVYCPDLIRLITHIGSRMRAGIEELARRSHG